MLRMRNETKRVVDVREGLLFVSGKILELPRGGVREPKITTTADPRSAPSAAPGAASSEHGAERVYQRPKVWRQQTFP